MTQPKRLRRCTLSVPGSNEKMMAKAANLDCDGVFLDLEDAVAPSAKSEARGLIVNALNSHEWRPRNVSVRINDVATEYCHDDIIEVVSGAGEKIDTIILTKANSAHDVMFLATLLDQLEQKLKLKNRIGIECLIEEVGGMMRLEEIADSSDRVESLVFGMGDYAASQAMDLRNIGEGGNYPPDIWHYPRYKLTIACRAFGIDPVDGPYANFRDAEGYQTECERASVLGMAGKWVIHPGQIPATNTAFSPGQEDVDIARKQKQAYEEALADGLGAIQVDGVMVDAASIRISQNMLDKADLIGM